MINPLLPYTATPFEHALANAYTNGFRFPKTIRFLWDPDQCPTEFLYVLAWSLDVPYQE
nr:hypothetical protein 3 [bacterium]